MLRGTTMIWRTAAALATLTSMAAGQSTASQAKSITLDNGLTVLTHPIPEADTVQMQAVYGVGFIHEPKGMTQAAHLLEHLVCNCATDSFKPGESMTVLNKLGMANAETLADWTHYDYGVLSDKLETALRIEAERLTGLKITPELIRQEAPRCYREVDFVEKNPKPSMLKFAFQALSQAWRHGARRATVRSGMEDFSIATLEQFHRDYYRPDNLTLILVGGFDRDEALQLIRKHLGRIRPPKRDLKPIDWSKLPPRATVHWDSRVRAVCIAFAPPADRTERIILSLWGAQLMSKLKSDSALTSAADNLFCSIHTWSVGDLPLFVYATPNPDTTTEQLTRLLIERLKHIVAAKPTAAELMQLHARAKHLAEPPAHLTWTRIQQSAKYLAAQGRSPDQARGMVMGQTALNWGAAQHLFGSHRPAALRKIKSLTAEDLHRIIQRTISEKNRFITVLTPEPRDP